MNLLWYTLYFLRFLFLTFFLDFMFLFYHCKASQLEAFRACSLSLATTLCLKKVPTFKLSVTLSNLNRFSKFLHCCKAYEICYKTIWHYPPHLRHVATLLWEIKNSNFLQMGNKMRKPIACLIASNFVIHPQILIFSAFMIASLSPYWL